MKNKFTHFLMAGALVCWSSYTLHAQTEVTDTYLKNPIFCIYNRLLLNIL